jgi:tetratricopeptide (TPR) repeat protein
VSLSPRQSALLTLTLASVVTAALYAPELDHPFIWDDYVQIAVNPAVRDGVPWTRYFLDRSTTSTRNDYNTRIYRPLRNWAMRGLWRLGDLAPQHRACVFHTANLLLYLVGGWLVFLIALRLARDELAAAIGASLWLLLPVHAEDVLYASAFGDILSMAFQLGGLWYAIRALDEPARERAAIVVSAVLFALAILTKEMAITSVLIVPAYVISERRAALRELAMRRSAMLVCALHLGVALAYLTLRTALLRRISQEDSSLSALLNSLLQMPRLVLFNLQVAVMPLGHAPDYGWGLKGVPRAIGGAVLLGAMLWLCLRRSGRGLRFGALVFVLGLSPVLQLVPMWTLLADRFLLVPSVGLALAMAAVIASTSERRRPLAFLVAAVLALTSAGGLAVERRRFQDDAHFWAYATATVHDATLSRTNLGLMFLKRGEPEKALPELLSAYDLGARTPVLFQYLAGAFEGIKRYDEAEGAARQAVAIEPDEPAAYAQLSSVLRHRGKLAEAHAALDNAQRYGIAPEIFEEQYADLLFEEPARAQEALVRYRELTRKHAGHTIAWAKLGVLALRLGIRDEAVDAATKCGSIDPCQALRAMLAMPAPPPAPTQP